MSRSFFAKLHRRFGTRLSGAERFDRAHAKQMEFMSRLGLATVPSDCARALPNGVAIVGGGFAGLSAAWTLGQAGLASTVFEARKTYGGRVESDPSLIPGRIIESGAELIGLNHPMWLTLARRFGLGLAVLTGEDQYAGAGLEMPLRLGGKVVTDPKKLHKQMAFVFRRISNDAKAITDPFKPWTVRSASTLDAKSVAEKIAEFVRLLPKPTRHPLLVEAIELELGNDHVLPTKEQSYLGLLAVVSGGRMGTDDVHLDGYWNDREEYRCAEGNAALAGMMLEFGKRILLRPNSPVKRIEISESDPLVKVTWLDSTRGYQSKSFDYVVLTAPPSVWTKITITPALPPGQEMGLGPAVKHISQVHGRFWIKAGTAPSGLSDELGQTWEPTENQALASRGVALTIFAGGAFVPRSDAEKHFTTQLLKLYPGYKGKTIRYADWPNVEWIETGYACPKVGQVTTIAKFLSVPHKKRLYFAGEHTCMAYFGYMEGALQSGLRAAEAILDSCLKKSSVGVGREHIVHQIRESVDEGVVMNLAARNRFLDEAERALQSTHRERRQSEISFLPRLLSELGGRVPATGLSPAELFRSVLCNRPLMHNVRDVLQVLATPSQQPENALRPGDWMLRAVPGTGDVGHVSVLASGDLLTPSALASQSIAAESVRPGQYGLVIEAGAFPHSRVRPFARRLLDSRGRVPPNTVFLRPTFRQSGAAPELPPDDPELEGPQRAIDVEQLDSDAQEQQAMQIGGTYTIVDSDARIRSGPPDFRFIVPIRTLPRNTAVRVEELQGSFARVQGADGTALGWTAAANLGRYYKDDATLVAAPLVPVSLVAINNSWGTKTRAIANTYNRLGGLMGALARNTGAPLTACLAVWYVESGGRAHDPGHAIIRFENHRFFRAWGRQHVEIYDRHFQHGGPNGPHENHKFREQPEDAFLAMHTGTRDVSQSLEYRALALATRLSTEDIALQCISIGGPQIMVDNYSMIGYSSPKELYGRFQQDERWHVLGFFDFCQFRTRKRGALITHLQQGDYRSFASIYNGPKQVDNYSKWISEAHAIASSLDIPATSESKPARETDDIEQIEDEVFEDFDQFAEDDPAGGAVAPAVAPATPATIGFEFDLNVGLSRDVFTARAADMPHGATFPGPGDKITDHREDDATGKLIDGFNVKADGPRLEIATLPIKINDDATFTAVVKNVIAFARELEAERGKVTADGGLSVPNVAGHPVRFTHPRTVISKFPLVIAVRGPQSGLKWPSDRVVWSAPQATITILLEHVGELIDAIAKSAGTGMGKALSGGSSQRLGVRSDIAVKAKRRVLADRTVKIGTELSDKSKVTAADYSLRLAGLLTLMTSYLLTSEIVDSDDYELFAKAYLPINVKAPFRDLFRDALTARERLVFKELYFNNRANFFALAKDRATTSAEDNELFPDKVRGPDLDRFHLHRLTWGTLLDNTVNDIPLKVTRANAVAKKKHALGDEVLWAPISKIIPFASTKPRVALELRRIGFAAHPVKFWEPLMNTVRTLTKKL